MNDYDRGFSDGLLWVANLLRQSATIVESPLRGDYNRNGGQQTFRAITRSGNPTLAAKFRAVADLLEEATKETRDDAAT